MIRQERHLSRSTGRRVRGTSQIAEFGPVMWIFFILFVFPLIDLASFLWGVSTVMLVANMSVKDAACAQTFSQARTAVDNTVAALAPFASFAKMTPRQASGNGATLVCLVTDIASTDAPKTYKPGDTIPVSATDLSNNTYQYCVTADYDVMPLFNFQGNPVLGGIPGLSSPVPVSFSSTATVEHPDGLNN